MSNAYATAEPRARMTGAGSLVVFLLHVAVMLVPAAAKAQQDSSSAASSSGTQRAATIGLFVAGGALALAAHEGGHLMFDVLFDADPGLERVDFHGIPFFAITHRNDLSPEKEFAISSAG